MNVEIIFNSALPRTSRRLCASGAGPPRRAQARSAEHDAWGARTRAARPVGGIPSLAARARRCSRLRARSALSAVRSIVDRVLVSVRSADDRERYLRSRNAFIAAT